MKTLNKILLFYKYVYYRIYLLALRGAGANENYASISTGFTMTYSGASLFITIDLLIKRYVNNDFMFNNYFYYVIIFAVIFLLQFFFVNDDISILDEKFNRLKNNKIRWLIGGCFFIFIVFFPMVMVIILM